MGSFIKSLGFYVPKNVVTNNDLTLYMDTSDEWIQERTGIQERRYATRHKESTVSLAAEASRIAIERAGINPNDIDFIIFATLSPDYFFPGCGVLLQRELGITSTECGALDVRNQCSGFIYAMSVAHQFASSNMYKNILVVGAEVHSMGLDYTTRGRNVTVIFGDGAGAAIVQPTDKAGHGILATCMHSDGTHAEELAFINPGCHGGRYGNIEQYGYLDDQEYGGIFLTQKMLDDGLIFPQMNGQLVFKHAVQKMPDAIMEVLNKTGHQPSDLKMLIPHQANLRIASFIQHRLKLRDDQVYNNIHKYGNTTAASIPIALTEAHEQGLFSSGDLVCLTAFGSGFTWGAVLMRWA
ncbi:MAG TPA: beta-ketoacyl-ACP synthase III [Saprospiraceae bacterium]|nr:beta-ketoacyl-ACP synthase III [Saprospiraceae bacterium]